MTHAELCDPKYLVEVHRSPVYYTDEGHCYEAIKWCGYCGAIMIDEDALGGDVVRSIKQATWPRLAVNEYVKRGKWNDNPEGI